MINLEETVKFLFFLIAICLGVLWYNDWKIIIIATIASISIKFKN